MSLSSIKGEQCFDVFADIMEPILNIASDPEAMEYFKVQEVPEGVDPQEYSIEISKKLMPLVLKKHKDDLIEILAAIDGKTSEEYLEELTVPKLFKSIHGLMTDPVFRSFLF